MFPTLHRWSVNAAAARVCALPCARRGAGPLKNVHLWEGLARISVSHKVRFPATANPSPLSGLQTYYFVFRTGKVKVWAQLAAFSSCFSVFGSEWSWERGGWSTICRVCPTYQTLDPALVLNHLWCDPRIVFWFFQALLNISVLHCAHIWAVIITLRHTFYWVFILFFERTDHGRIPLLLNVGWTWWRWIYYIIRLRM